MYKLVPELVPSSCWYSNVRTNVSRSQWDIIRKKVYSNANYNCEICGGRGLKWPVECHEIWDYNEETHIQTLTGFVAICPSCHMVKHIGLAGIKGKTKEATSHMIKVNQCSILEAQHAISKCWADWQRRSEIEWILDISYLDNFNISGGI